MENRLYIDIKGMSKCYEGSFYALKDIDIHIDEGEKIGIIGRNGAGKSTLLKILAGYADQTEGCVDVNGKVSAILEVGTSIQAEMTGRENIYLGGELYGLSKDKIDEIMPEIIEFVDIGDYFDRPVKTYSSGMRARLSFSLISFVEPEILIIDEALGVGDASFVNKSAKKVRELCASGKILLIVSHSMGTIKEFTERSIWIEQGKIMLDGPTKEVVDAYQKYIRKFESDKLRQEVERRISLNNKEGIIKITNFSLKNGEEELSIFELYEDIHIILELQIMNTIQNPDICLRIENMKGILIMENYYSEDMNDSLTMTSGNKIKIETVIPKCSLAEDLYEILCTVYQGEEIIAERMQTFRMVDTEQDFYAKPLLYADAYWDVEMDGEGLGKVPHWHNSFEMNRYGGLHE